MTLQSVTIGSVSETPSPRFDYYTCTLNIRKILLAIVLSQLARLYNFVILYEAVLVKSA